MKSIPSLKSPTVLFVVGALAVGAVGSKMLWTDSLAIKVPVATVKPKTASATHVVDAAAQARQTPRELAASKRNAASAVAAASAIAPAAESAPAAAAAAPAPAPASAQRVSRPAIPVRQQATIVPIAPQEALPAQPAAAETDEAPAYSRPAPLNIAAAKRVQPSEVDTSSDTEGLFLISSLKDNQSGDAAPPAQAANSPAASAPETRQTTVAPSTGAQTTLSEPANNALGERVVTTAAGPVAAPGPVTDGLGPVFVDDANGYYLRFPAGWSIRKFDGAPWVIECGDGKSALMSVGFSPFPAEYTADNIPLDWVARRVNKRPNTVLDAQGYATIMGRKAIWSKSTGPMQMGGNQVKVIRTTYIVPLGDGRIAEIRIAAAPDQFNKLANLMKNAVSTFRLVPKRMPETQVARTE